MENSVRPRLPEWIRVKSHVGKGKERTATIIKEHGLNTVCQSAKCPNLCECWHKKTATFMILGNNCTRSCRFCSVNHSEPTQLDENEPLKVAIAAKEMNLKYVVLTSVTRDDLPDGGARIFADTIRKIREINGNEIKIEVLTPDFNGEESSIKTVLDAEPTVFNHNLETVRRLSKEIRITASYDRSLSVLKTAFDLTSGKIPSKSGIMVGLGESDDEILESIKDLRSVNVSLLTIGQYLPPTSKSWNLDRYVHPDVFLSWKEYAISLGFTNVASGPLVRSSYCAEELHGEQS